MRNVVRLDDLSPVIRYQPGVWHTGLASEDPYAPQYSDGGTYTTTNTTGASVSIAWNGTGIAVYGAKRINHGNYTVSLDNAKPATLRGFSRPRQFGVALFKAHNLTNSHHVATLSDASSTNFDIDYVDLETQVGQTAIRLEDTDAAFQYLPQSAWSTTSNLIKSFSGNSGHVSSATKATVELRFTGNAIDVFGLVCPACGSFSVQLDGTALDGTFSAYNSVWSRPQTMLYMARNLGDGEHRLVLTSQDTKALSIDYAVAHTRGPGEGDNASSNRVSPGTIAGAVVGGMVVVLAVIGAALWARRRRKGRHITAYSEGSPPSTVGRDPYDNKNGELDPPVGPPPYEPPRFGSIGRHNPAADNPLKQTSELY